jgi:poly-gamma-glutamate synthesis protein (capsule biosynthesis protein)
VASLANASDNPLRRLRGSQQEDGEPMHGDTKKSKLTIGAGGDLLFNSDMMKEALNADNGYQSFFTQVQSLVQYADIFYSNYETATAECVNAAGEDVPDCPLVAGGDVYRFTSDNINNFPFLASDLVAVGYDVVSLTNNHIGDRDLIGVEKTKEVCDNASLANFGVRGSSAEQWHTVVSNSGWNVAWVGCTGHLTNRSISDYPTVLNCSSPDFLPLVESLSKDKDIDAVIATVHWYGEREIPHWQGGNIYTTSVHQAMRDFSTSIIAAGAVAVLGAHPHVLMEWETHGNGIIFYSLGNMVASQAYSNTSLESCRKVSCGEEEVLATQCRARTGAQKEECCTQYCKHLLQSNVVMSFDLVASADGTVRFSCLNYTATTWDNSLNQMRIMTELEAESSWAREILQSPASVARHNLWCE